ncbi:hypothetical protein ABTZ44_07545 [Microbacterium oxydans]|uniref:hypothetical protein n=1 Tax=Microbacterium oxydans TaxID=82380 RepID=UPI00332210C8
MTATENYHHVELKLEGGELHCGFTCTAPEDAACRRRPKNADQRESWTAAEATGSGHQCWASEWVDAVGIEGAIIGTVDDQVLASVSVAISFEEGVGIEPIRTPDLVAAAETARSDAEWSINIDRQGGA